MTPKAVAELFYDAESLLTARVDFERSDSGESERQLLHQTLNRVLQRIDGRGETSDLVGLKARYAQAKLQARHELSHALRSLREVVPVEVVVSHLPDATDAGANCPRNDPASPAPALNVAEGVTIG